MTGNTNSSLLAIQMCESELQTGAKCTKDLMTHTHINTSYKDGKIKSLVT